jgi:hypothetical protein
LRPRLRHTSRLLALVRVLRLLALVRVLYLRSHRDYVELLRLSGGKTDKHE